jgi:hypothetical protein
MLILQEKIYIVLIIILIIHFIIKSVISVNKLEVFSPIVFIALIFLVYTVIGPLIFLNFDFNIFPEKFIRQFYLPAWKGSFFSLLFIYIGYIFFGKRVKRIKKYIPKPNKMFLVALAINLTGIFLYALANPTRFYLQLNPFSGIRFPQSSDLGGFTNYFVTAINFLIAGNALMLISIKKISVFSTKFWVFIIFMVITFSIYSSLGFRYRLLLLGVTVFVSYFLNIKSRPSLIYLILIIPIFIGFMGFMSKIRSHDRGLIIKNLDKNKDDNFLIDAFKETNIFPISGVVIKAVPEKVDYVYTDIFLNAMLLPIPRKFYPEKNTDSYIRKPIKAYKQLAKINAENWAAMFFFSEWYIAFGWFGIIGISFFLGFIYRRIWEWTKENINNGYIIVIYATSLSFLYFFITRGYLPGAITIFAFSVFPSNIARFFGRLRLKGDKTTIHDVTEKK